MDTHENLLLAVQTPLTQLGAPDFLTDLPKAMYVMVMIVVLFLPLLMIPYIFIKMGSVAGKVQASLNSVGRGLRKGATKAATKQAKGAAGRAWQNKSAQWAGRGDGTLRNRVGGYKAQRDHRLAVNSSEAKRKQDEAIRARLVDPRDRYAERVAGVGGARQKDTIIASAQLAEQKASAERTAARQAAFQVEGLSSSKLQERHETFIRERDIEGANAALNQMMQMGAGGRQAAAESLDNISRLATDEGIVLTPQEQNQVNQNLFSNHGGVSSSRGDIAKGFMEDGVWKPKDINKLALPQFASQEPETVNHFISNGGAIEPKMAYLALQDVNIKSTIHQDNRAIYEAAAAKYVPPTTPTPPSTPPSAPPSAPPAPQQPNRPPLPPGASGGLQGDHSGPNDLWIPREKP